MPVSTQAISQLAGNIGQTTSGVVSGITGFFQRKQGNKLLKENPFPTEAMPAEVLANQQIAQGAAQQGLPSEQYQQAQRAIQRNQSAALNSATDRRAGVTSIGAIQEGTNNAQGNLDAANAEARRQNIGQLLGVNNQVASWKDKLFDWNQRAKYEQNRSYAMPTCTEDWTRCLEPRRGRQPAAAYPVGEGRVSALLLNHRLQPRRAAK